MAHDFTHDASGLPSAPLPVVHEAIDHAVQLIPKEKFILAISKQANQWAPNTVNTLQPSIQQVEDRLLAEGTNAHMSFPFFLQRIHYFDEIGEHVIWYENTDSIAKKMWLAKYNQLHGVSLWHMGSVTEKDWNLMKDF
jgi:spore germination protein YaaH